MDVCRIDIGNSVHQDKGRDSCEVVKALGGRPTGVVDPLLPAGSLPPFGDLRFSLVCKIVSETLPGSADTASRAGLVDGLGSPW